MDNDTFIQLNTVLKSQSNPYFVPSTSDLGEPAKELLHNMCRMERFKGVKYFLGGFGLTKEELYKENCAGWRDKFVGLMKKERNKVRRGGGVIERWGAPGQGLG